jgi:hypothetical protein
MRKAWWEMNPNVKQYRHKHFETWRRIEDKTLQNDILRLPRGFTCYHFRKNIPIEERMRPLLITALTRDLGCFEYDMLELERAIFKFASRRW